MSANIVTQQIQDSVSSLYIAFFGRAPDAAGFGYWAEEMAGDVSPFAIAANFARSDEWLSNYGGLTPTQQVITFYQNVFGRTVTADDEGVQYWVEEINGGLPASSVAYQIIWAAYLGGEGVDPNDNAIVLNKIAVAEFFATDLKSNDTALAATAFNGVTQDEATVQAAEDRLSEVVSTYTLTTGADTASSQYFDGSAVVTTAGAFLQTLNNTDRLTGTGDNATLYADLVNANVTPLSLAGIVNVDVEMSNSAGSTINALNANAIKNVTVSNSANAFTINNLSTAISNLSVANGTAGLVTLTSLAAALAGTEDAIAVTYSDTTGAGGLNLSPATGTNGYETINLVSNGSAAQNIGAITAVGANTLNVSGAANMTTVVATGTIRTVDASTMTGNLDVTAANAVVTVTGGAGNDTVRFAAGQYTRADVVDGGAGTNTLRADLDDLLTVTAANTNITAIQTLAIDGASTAGGTLRADLFGTAVNRVTFLVADASANTIRFNAGANTVDARANLGALTVEANGTATTDTLTLNLGPLATAAAANVTVGNLNLDSNARSIEQLTINSNNGVAVHTVGTVTLPGTPGVINQVTVAGDTSLTIGTVTADALDASGLTSNAGIAMDLLTLSGAAIAITGSAGADTLVGSAGNDSISTGAGDDVVLGGGGIDGISLSGGNNQAIFISDSASAVLSAANFTLIGGFTVGSTAASSDLFSIDVTAGTFTAGPLLNFDGATAVAGGDALDVLNFATGSALTATATDNFLKITSGVAVGAVTTAQTAFDTAMGAGTVTVGAPGGAYVGSFFDATNNRAVLFTVSDGDGDSLIEATETVAVISMINMTSTDYATFGVNQIDFI